MTQDQRKRALRLIARPPRGSKLARAKKYGVDLTLLVENLSLTPTERAEKLSNGAKSLQALRLAGERYRSKMEARYTHRGRTIVLGSAESRRLTTRQPPIDHIRYQEQSGFALAVPAKFATVTRLTKHVIAQADER